VGTLGIIAGGGDLPLAIADCAVEAGRGVFIAALQGMADEGVAKFAHDWASIGEAGKILKLLRQNGCDDVLLAGKVSRPKWADVKFDAKGLMVLPKVVAAGLKGDDSILRLLVANMEAEGFHVVGAVEAAPALLAPAGAMGRVIPSQQDHADIALAAKVVRRLGALDIGQAAAVCEGLVLAVEAAEGTDAMIARIATLADNLRGSLGKPKGVLVKAPKPTQDRKTDMPVIGVETVRKAAAVGLGGIAVEAGGALIVNRRGVIEAADAAGMFVFGFERNAIAE
jgi:UDP-2,3-diacylglucosamine hydrolase